MKVRIKFRKFGTVKFIGHLDMMRFFQKAIRRAGIDIAYTAGFSPHQIMSFAAPLGVGLESNGEYMDIELNSMESSRDIVERLNAVSVEGIEILSAKVLPEGAGNAMASVAAAGYTVRFREGRNPAFPYKEKLAEFYESPHIIVQKQTKKSTVEMDLKPGIFLLELRGDDIYMLIDAGSAGNIKPSLIMDTFYAANGEEPLPNAYTVTREETYLNTGSGDEPNLEPLDAIGTERQGTFA